MNLCIKDLPKKLQEQLRGQAAKEGLCLRELVVKALSLYLRSKEAQE